MLPKKFKAGEYREQYEYESFEPALINREMDWLSDRKISLSAKVDEEIKGFKSFLEENNDVKYFVDVLQLKEAGASCRMDAAKVNFTETLLPLEFIKPDRMNDWLDVMNYLEALKFARERIEDLPISFRLLNEIHSIALAGPKGEKKTPGEIRKSQTWVGGENLSKAKYIPPHPYELQDYLTDLEKFIHNDYLEAPFLTRLALAHYQFMIIQPYVSGNGRMARLLVLLMLNEHYKFKYPLFLFNDLIEFYTVPFHESIFSVPKSENINQYIKFFLNRLSDAVKRSITTLEKLISIKSKKESLVDGIPLEAEKIYLILYEFYKKPILHEKILKEKFRDMNIVNLLKMMEEKKIIEVFDEIEDERFYYIKKSYNQLKM